MKALAGLFVVISLQALSYGLNVPDRDGGRIVGGVEIPLSEAPYQVSLLNRGGHICGGSIISSNFVLTACHCTTGTPASFLSVRVGSRELEKGGEVFTVNLVINHPRFDRYSLDYDFALLRLSKNIQLDGSSKTAIKLPPIGQAIADGTMVFISGWGATRNSLESNKVLRGVVVPTINQAKCDKIYTYDGGVTNQMVCAGSSGKDSCNGDSGGPMKRISDGVLIGVVSFGMDCADRIYPGVYSRVASVRSWIRTYSGV